MSAKPLNQREIDEWYDDSQLTHTEITLEEEQRLWATIIQLREDAAALVDAGDVLCHFVLEHPLVGDEGLFAVNDFRNTPGRDRNRRWKRSVAV